MTKSITTKKLVKTALMLALGLVFHSFTYMVYMGGGAGMRLGIAGFFTKLPAFLFGPLYGGLCMGAADFLGYVIKPDGAYIFPLTLTSALSGVMVGFLFGVIKKVSEKKIKVCYFVLLSVFAVVGIVNLTALKFMSGSTIGKLLLSFGDKANFFTYGILIVVVLGILFFIINEILLKKFKLPIGESYLKIFTVLLPVDLFITTLNTFILIAFIPALAKINFWIFYTPRLAQEIVSVFITSLAISYLKQLAEKIK